MSNDNGKLIVFGDWEDYYRIKWSFPEDAEGLNDMGAALGDDLALMEEPLDLTNEHQVATRAVVGTGEQTDSRDYGNGFYWASRSAAAKALTLANAAIKAAKFNRPLEDWEQKALAAGWKPPKGWRG